MRVLAGAVLAALVTAGSASARAQPETFAPRSSITPQISSNWSGYAAIAADPAAPVTFTDVTATWKVPKGTCTTGRTSSAAFWVGLGGYDPSATSLEQLGTAAECDGVTRTPTYDAWWELVPAASVRIPLAIRAGDTVTAAVLVAGQKITYSLKDVTRGTRFSKVLAAEQPLDTSSAEWIAEAPSSCSSAGHCRVVPLTNFGTVTFGKIAAIGNAHGGTLTDPLWTTSSIELIANGDAGAFFGGGDVLGPGVGAVPGDVSADGRSFAVSWARNLTP
jgi:Peptidase A4 family